MLHFSFIAEDGYRDTHPDVEISWDGCEELTLDEHVEKFRTFLLALTFTEKQVESIQIVDNDRTVLLD